MIAALCISAAVLIADNNLHDSFLKLVMVLIYSAMTVFAVFLYRVLEEMVWGPSKSSSDQNHAISPDDLDEHLPQGGRIPRSMDASDPASGSLWIGNHSRDELIKDHMHHRHR